MEPNCRDSNPYESPKGIQDAYECIRMRWPWVLGSVVLAVVPAVATVWIASKCFLGPKWLAVFGEVYFYFGHALILAVLYGIAWVSVEVYERITKEKRVTLFCKVVVGVTFCASALLGWVMIFFAYLVTFY